MVGGGVVGGVAVVVAIGWLTALVPEPRGSSALGPAVVILLGGLVIGLAVGAVRRAPRPLVLVGVLAGMLATVLVGVTTSRPFPEGGTALSDHLQTGAWSLATWTTIGLLAAGPVRRTSRPSPAQAPDDERVRR